MVRLLVVDADAPVAQAVTEHLRSLGYEVTWLMSGQEALVRAVEQRPDLVIVDQDLPDVPGTTLCRELRAEPKLRRTSIIVLGARDDEIDRVVAFEVGADDFVVKPLSVRELGLRVRAILRHRKPPTENGVPRVVGLELDPAARRVFVKGREVVLSPLELRLLITFRAQHGRVLTREALLEDVWGRGEGGSPRTVDACVKRLRQKLGAAGRMIETVRGVGYRLVASREGDG